ncbi:LacI family DNA-binding transcriptional regulator [Herbiconiux sp. KACC 21604]|uniref:LacI family DNA-binding transcriptional regulator n=1 Tax=unclassified Herbiconiux TaxID=2618217 RepID=UPI00149158A2|nr:LacI family DNA-binding transcriptional regulator [Herbiconiux sp. SALV-R1]QJU55081.1 LacI family DNA-binding transcriptional regulator [Herbiconiux sp. SALV-R1]WPO86226.1 LacI family DNA-binding transcriptional regulator [Herbiconiux sp. KACC 21604]
MANSKPTITDVARAAGVSKGLVSFALNDRPGVSAETRSRILEVARELDYRPSLSARSLSTSTSYAVGLVIARDPEILSADPFFPAFIAGVERVLSAEGRALVLSVVRGDDDEEAVYRSLAADKRVDGVFLTDLRDGDPRVPLVGALGLAAVTLGRTGDSTAFPAVVLDDTAGTRAAVAHLVEHGHRRIAHVVGPHRMMHAQRRHAAFREAMASAGLPVVDELVVETDFTAAQGASATARLLDLADPPTAIVFDNDPMAIAGLGVAHERGLRIPDDLSITGFDDSELARYVYPALTSVRSDPLLWGEAAARALLVAISSRANGTAAAASAAASVPDIELDPAHLVVRASTGPARA